MDDGFLTNCLNYTTGKDINVFTYNDDKFSYGLEDILCHLAAPVPIKNRHLQLRHDDFTKATKELYTF